MGQCTDGEVRIDFTHVVSAQGHPKGEAAGDLARRVNDELNGRACMVVHPASELYDDDDAMLAALAAGEVQMAVPTFSKLGGISTRFGVFDLPFLFDDLAHVIAFTDTPDALALLDDGRDAGIVGLNFWMTGMSQLSATRPIVTPEDVAGLHFRIQGSAVEEATFAALGATTQKLAFRDVRDRLADGTVNAQANTWTNIWLREFYMEQDGATASNHGLVASMLITSQVWLDSLEPDLRDDLLRIADEVTHEWNRFADELNEVALMNLRAEGVPVRRLSADQREVWAARMRPVWATFAPEIGAELIDAAYSMGSAPPQLR